MSLQSLKMLSNAMVFEKNIWLLTGLAGVHVSGHLLPCAAHGDATNFTELDGSKCSCSD